MSDMELGNLIFGNSRGERQVPRTVAFEGPWERLCEALKISSYGYPDDGCTLPTDAAGNIDTPVFRIRSYDWDAACDCGFEEQAEAWHEANPHRPECYQTALKNAMEKYDADSKFPAYEKAAFGDDNSFLSGFDNVVEHPIPGMTTVMSMPRKDAAMEAWREAHDLRETHEEEVRRSLCAERNLPFPDGSAVHCDCQTEKDANVWFREHDHAPTCRLVQPNFLYKPTGFKLHWYKYPLRDSYMTPGISGRQWSKLIDHCIMSAAQ